MTLYDSFYIKFYIELKKLIYKKSYGIGRHRVSQLFETQMGERFDERKVYRTKIEK